MLAGDATNYFTIQEAFQHQQETIGVDVEEDGEASQFQRFNWFWAPRVYNGVVEDAGRLENYSLKLSEYFSNEICLENVNHSDWQPLGPTSYPEQWMGAVTAVWADPNEQPLLTIYAGATSGGLWKTTDGGQHWTCITDSQRLPILGICSIAKSNGRLWIGTGVLRRTNYSAGVFWSDDEGLSWNRVDDIPALPAAGLVRSVEAYGQEIYVAQERNLWYSSDNGSSFIEITPGIQGHPILNDGPPLTWQNRFTRLVRFMPQSGPSVLVVTSMDWGTEGNGALIYASESNGDEWVSLSDQIDLDDQSVSFNALAANQILNSTYQMAYWHGWDNNQQDHWQYDGTYNEDGFNGVMRYLPTQIGNEDPIVFLGNNPTDVTASNNLTRWDTPYKVSVQFRKDPCANFAVYLTGLWDDDLNMPNLDGAQVVYSTYEYPGAMDNSAIPLVEFDANSQLGTKYMVIVGDYPGMPNPCIASTGILIDKIELLTDAIEVSNVDVVQDPSSDYLGYHVAAKAMGDGTIKVFSGTGLDDFALTGTISAGGLTDQLNTRYQNFRVDANGRVYTAGTCGVFYAEQDGQGNYTEAQTDWLVFGAQTACGSNNGYSTDPGVMHCDFRCLQLLAPTAGQMRILAGDDGGMAYLSSDGTWYDLNGEGLAIQECYGFGTDEFANRLVGGAQDNNCWRYDFGEETWSRFGGGDGGHSHMYMNRTGTTELEATIQHKFGYLEGEVNGNPVDEQVGPANEGLGRPSTLYVGNEARFYVGQDGIQMVTETGAVENLVDAGPEVFADLKGTPWGLGIHPRSDDIIFFGVMEAKPGWEPPFNEAPTSGGGRFFRTFNHGGSGNDWQDITWNLFDQGNTGAEKEVYRRYGMQDVEIDPDSDPNDPTHLTVYVAMNGVPEEDGVERVFKSEDGGDTWQDISVGLPGFPVMDLECQPGSGGIVYAATDVGVFVYDPALQQWLCFNEDLPVCLVTQVRVNACTGQLFCSTMGRGYWRTGLYKPEQATERVITADETITGQVISRQDIRVAAPNTLTIQGELLMYPDRRIMVDPGARLVVDGGLIDSYCQGKWDGIEVRGVESESQVPLTNQGYLELDAGARIEHAEIAVRLYQSNDDDVPDPATTGGVLKIYGQSTDPVYIRDCIMGVHMLPYENRPNGGNEVSNRTSVAWAVFETDEVDAESFARMEDVYGITFSHCTFRDNASSENWYNEIRPNGIESFSTKFTVRFSRFERLRSGVEASNDGLLNPCFIRDNLFMLNKWGILLDGVHAAEVTENEFLIPQGALYGNQDPLEQTDPPLGLYLHSCEGYEVEENNFTSEQEHAVGLVVTDNSSGANQFYRNTFDGLLVGSLLQGDNRDVDGQGLQCLCNDYGLNADNMYKIAITWGGEIAEFQGVQASQFNPAKPAGNRFNPECAAGTDQSDIYIQDDGQMGFTYLRNSDAICDPACRTVSFVNVINTLDQYADEQSSTPTCPSQLGHGHNINDHLLKYALYKQAYTDLKIYLDGQLDGGDTPELLTLIHEATVSSFTLRLELLAASPRLTDRVMIDAINRAPAMDPWHLAQVLLANSPLTPDVLLTLDRSNVLPLYRDMVAAAQTGGLSVKSMLEAELAGYRLGMEGPRFDAVRYYLERDTIGWPLDSVFAVIGDAVVPSAAYNIAALHVARGDWSAANAIIDNAANNGLDSGSVLVLTLLMAIRQDPLNATALVIAAAQDLEEMAAGTTSAGAAARSLLAQYTGATFEHPVVLPGNSRARSSQVYPASEQANTALEVMPNPASTMVRIVIRQNPGPGNSALHLYDAQGRHLREWRLSPGIQLLEEDISPFANGQYRLRLLTAEGIQRTTSFQIAR